MHIDGIPYVPVPVSVAHDAITGALVGSSRAKNDGAVIFCLGFECLSAHVAYTDL